MRQLFVSMVGLVMALALVFAARPALAQETVLAAALVGGAEEVPNPGDPDGYGGAGVTFPSATQVCFALDVANITLPAAAAHIHEGAKGVAGPVVVPLTAPDASGKSDGCMEADAALLTRIRESPAQFYVNVHTSDFPAGAIRGQLAMAPADTSAPLPATGANDGSTLWVASIAILAIVTGVGLRLSSRRRVSAS